MTDPLAGPAFRPEHPDLMKLTEIVLQLDGAATEGGQDFEDMIAVAVDPKSLAYMAMQRAMRATGAKTQAEVARDHRNIIRLASVYHEAFLMGFKYRDRYGKPEGER